MTRQNLPVVFLAFANDQGDGEGYLRQLRNEAEQLRDLLEQAGQVCELVVRQNASLKNILDVFQSPRYKHRIAIFHFGGHANSYQLLLESAEGKAMPANAAGLAAFLSQQRGLHLVFLNGCATGEQAQGLLDAGVQAVIATDRKIFDAAAVTFAARFYEGLLSGYGEADGLQSAFIAAEGTVQAELGQLRHAYNQPEYAAAAASRTVWPWQLYPANPPPEVATWNLAKAAKNPYFGLSELPPGRRLPQQPFRGLSYFHEKHAEIFFGRGWQIRTLFQLITDETVSANPIILLYGQSGVGKSSLLAAGLLPRLKQVARVRYVRREDAGNNLTAALKKAVESGPPSPPEGGISVQTPPFGGPGETSEAAIVDLPTAKRDQDGPALADCWLAQETDDRSLVIILDQVEEVITRPGDDPEQEMTQFLDVVDSIFGEAVDPWPRGKLILGFRKEWLADIEDRLNARELPYKEMFLKHLDRDGIIEAIIGPATTPRLKAQYELQVVDELPVVIADNLLADRGSAIAPTLQIILTRLWENATGKPKIFNRKLYDDLRLQPANFLGQLLDQQLTQLEARHPHENASDLVLDLLNYHTTEFGTARQHTGKALARQYSHLPEIVPALVQSCKDRYLLVDPVGDADEEATDATRLAHDTLAPLIRYRYRDSEKPGPRAARVLHSKVPDFIRDKPDAALLDDADLAIVEAGQNGMRVWNADEQRLVEASRQARAKRQRNRRIWQGVGVVAVALIVMFAAVAALQWREAVYQADVNKARELAALAVNRLEEDPEESIRIAIQAITTIYETYDEPPIIEAEQALHQAVQASRVRHTFYDHKTGAWNLTASSDGSLLVTINLDNTIGLWDPTASDPFQTSRSISSTTFVSSIALNLKGDRLVVGDDKGNVQLWDIGLTEPYLLRVFSPYTETVIEDLAISPNGQYLAVGSPNRKIKLLDMETGVKKDEKEFDHDLCGIAFSQNGQYLATGGKRGVVFLWDLTTGDIEDYDHGEEIDQICAVGFNPADNTMMITGGMDEKAKLWHIGEKQPFLTLQGHTNTVSGVAFSPDGEYIVTGSFDHTAKLWDAASGRLLLTLSGHQESILDLDFILGGQYLVTTSLNAVTKIWDLGGHHQDEVWRVVFNTDGTQLATVSNDGTVRIWDPNGKQLARFEDGTNIIWDAAFDPDDTHLMTVGDDGMLRIRDIRDINTATLIDEVKIQDESLFAVAFSPNQTHLAAGGETGSVFLLDAKTRQELRTIQTHESPISAIAFHPDGELFAVGGTSTAVLLDVNRDEPIMTFTHQDGRGVLHLAFSPDKRHLATASTDNSVKVWDIEAETDKMVFEIAGHGDEVTGVTFSPDGAYLITASADRTAKVWDISNVEPAETLATARLVLEHPDRVNGLAISPSAPLLVTAGADGEVRFWPFHLNIKDMITLAQTRITR